MDGQSFLLLAVQRERALKVFLLTSFTQEPCQLVNLQISVSLAGGSWSDICIWGGSFSERATRSFAKLEFIDVWVYRLFISMSETGFEGVFPETLYQQEQLNFFSFNFFCSCCFWLFFFCLLCSSRLAGKTSAGCCEGQGGSVVELSLCLLMSSLFLEKIGTS